MKFDDFNGILKKVAEPHENLQKTDSGPEVFDDNFFTVQKHGKTHRTKKNHPTLAKTIFQNVCKKRRTSNSCSLAIPTSQIPTSPLHPPAIS